MTTKRTFQATGFSLLLLASAAALQQQHQEETMRMQPAEARNLQQQQQQQVSFFREYFVVTAIVLAIIAFLVCCRYTFMSRFFQNRRRRQPRSYDLPDLALHEEEAAAPEQAGLRGSTEQEEAQAYWNSLSKDKRESILEDVLTGTTVEEERKELQFLDGDEDTTVAAANTTSARTTNSQTSSSGIPQTDSASAVASSAADTMLASGDLSVVTSTTVECSICLEGFEAGDYMLKAKCGHVFHKSCLAEWVGTSKSTECPNCRAQLLTKDEILHALASMEGGGSTTRSSNRTSNNALLSDDDDDDDDMATTIAVVSSTSLAFASV